MSRLRIAEPDDIPAIVALGADMHSGSSFAPLGYDPERTAASLAHFIATGFGAVSLDADGAITGFIFGDVVQPWHSIHRMGVESVLYVRPQSQGSRAALMLVKAWATWCFESGAVQIRPGTSAGSAAADRLYQALGFKRAGELYVMNKE